ncbi:MAG TPA: GntR family transcriptional regulator [Casimicrobiaceae bacterium]|nr:GntR family transcriptional regulator [Casimicrobiaceae bacterium]
MSRVQTVVASLRDLVLSGRLAPGERIVELVYAPQLGVSRTPLRWALAELEREGLVERMPHRGYRVRAFTMEDVSGAIDVRGTLEGMAARLVAERGLVVEELATLEACLDEGRRLLADDDRRLDPERWARMNGRFHDVVVRGSRNDALIRAMESIARVPLAAADAITFSVALRSTVLKLMRAAHEDHVAIVEAMRHRQGARVEFLMREHAQRSRDNKARLIEQLKASRSGRAIPELMRIGSRAGSRRATDANPAPVASRR